MLDVPYTDDYTSRMKLAQTIIAKAKKLFDKSGMTMEELAKKMGNDSKTGRQSVWLIFNRETDLRVSTVEKLAEALGVTPKELM